MVAETKRRLTAVGPKLYVLVCLIPGFLIASLLGLDAPGDHWLTLILGVAMAVAMAVPVYFLLRLGDRILARLLKDEPEDAP